MAQILESKTITTNILEVVSSFVETEMPNINNLEQNSAENNKDPNFDSLLPSSTLPVFATNGLVNPPTNSNIPLDKTPSVTETTGATAVETKDSRFPTPPLTSEIDEKGLIAKAPRLEDENSPPSDDEFERLQEPYEDKYINLSTISALDFITGLDPVENSSASSDPVLVVVQRVANMAFVYSLVSTLFALTQSKLYETPLLLPWSNIHWFIALFWFVCLKDQGQLIPLTNTITGARRVSILITILYAIAYLSERLFYSLSSSPHSPIQSEAFVKHPLLYGGSMLSLPIFLILEQILEAYQKENFRKQALLREERANAQKAVHRAIDRFGERKGLYLRTISEQLRNTTDLATSTLRQLSPPNFLSKPHEQLSACSISIPTTSISAMHNTLKAINYISSHLGTLSLLLFADIEGVETSNVKKTFDIGEMLQNVGDALAGVASTARVELAIYHIDYGLYHLNVIGDEAALRHALLDLLKTILEGTNPDACIEVGLQVRHSSDVDKDEDFTDKDRQIHPRDKVTCTFEIIHNTSALSSTSTCPNANLTAKVLSFLDATLTADEEQGRQRFEISIELEAGPPLNPPNQPTIDEETRKRYPHLRVSGEPSIEELNKFSQTLTGLKVALHATTKSFFAKHLTSCLTTWSTDILHVPIGDDDLETPRSEINSNGSTPDASNTLPALPSPEADNPEEAVPPTPPAFIIIDDDINTLKEQLTIIHNSPLQSGVVSMMNARNKRHHAPPQVPQQTTAVIYFTSLTNYKSVKDTIQSIFSPTGSFSLPQVLVVPKPAGPRRFLTALHTASHKIVVDPVYMPIATSPMSPGQQYCNSGHNTVMESNPPDNEFPKVDESPYFFIEKPGVYIKPNGTSLAPNGAVIRNPSSPRSGPGGGLLVIPKKSSDTPKSEINNPNFMQSPITSPTKLLTSGSKVSPGIGNKSFRRPTSPPLHSPPLQNQTTPPPSQGGRKGSGKSGKTSKTPSTNSETIIPRINVLIVEDNPINQAILSTFMRKKKIKYQCALNGQEAVDKWKAGGFHIVLMDIQLPVKDGIEATKEIRHLEKEQKIGVLPPTPPTPPVASTNIPSPSIQSPVIIVALTASSLPSDRQKALAAGCNDFLTKPVNLEWLEKKIQEWGCMQALIDYEGWGKSKRGEDTTNKRSKKSVDNKNKDIDAATSVVAQSPNDKVSNPGSPGLIIRPHQPVLHKKPSVNNMNGGEAQLNNQ